MQIESLTVNIPNNGNYTTEYIEKELSKQELNPIRWAIVHVSDTIIRVNVANLKE